MQTRSGRIVTPSHSGTTTPRRRRKHKPDSAALEKHIQKAFDRPGSRTVVKSVRRTVAYDANDRRIERVVREEGSGGGVAQSAYRLRDNVRGLLDAAQQFVTSTGAEPEEVESGSELSEGDAVLVASSVQVPVGESRDPVSRVLDFSDGEAEERAGHGRKYEATARDMLPGVQAPGVHTEVFVRERRTIRVKNTNDVPRHLYGPDELSDVEDEMSQIAVTHTKNSPEDEPDSPAPTAAGTADSVPIFERLILALMSIWNYVIEKLNPGGGGSGLKLLRLGNFEIFRVRKGAHASEEIPFLIFLLFILLFLVAFLLPFLPLPVVSESLPAPSASPIPVANNTNITSTSGKEAPEPVPSPPTVSTPITPKSGVDGLSKEAVKRLVQAEFARLDLIGEDGKINAHLLKQNEIDEDSLKKRISNGVMELLRGEQRQGLDKIEARLKTELAEEMKKEMGKVTSEMKTSVRAEVDLAKSSQPPPPPPPVESDVKLEEKLSRKLSESIAKERKSLEADVSKKVTEEVEERLGNLESGLASMKEWKSETDEGLRKLDASLQTEIQDMKKKASADLDEKQKAFIDEKLAEAKADQKAFVSDELARFETKLKSEWKSSLSDETGKLKDFVQAKTKELRQDLIRELETSLAFKPDGSSELSKEDVLALIKAELDKLSLDSLYLSPEKEDQLRSDILSKMTSLSGDDFQQIQIGEIRDLIRNELETALGRYDADKTGKADYALRSAGGSVSQHRHSKTYDNGMSYFSFYGVRLWNLKNSPQTAIEPGVLPGQCWPFEGSKGFLVIKLAASIHVTEISYEHVAKNLTEKGTITSAPKEFSIQGVADEIDEVGTPLGSFTYDKDGPALQTFPLEANVPQPFRYVQFSVESNHGNVDYTCLYRIRVHGKPANI